MPPLDPLTADSVRLRWLETEGRPSSKIAGWRDLLDEEERARADRFRHANDRENFIAAHALLRSMLTEATGAPTDAWRFVTGAHGKPALADNCRDSGPCFNLAHTRGLAVCAIGPADIGVDVEVLDRRIDLATADRFFAPVEVLALRSAKPADQPEIFFRFWTLKESFIKATGEGLGRNLASFSFALEPVRISFHPTDAAAPQHDDPAGWQFAELRPRENRLVAISIRRSGGAMLQVDARAAAGDLA